MKKNKKYFLIAQTPLSLSLDFSFSSLSLSQTKLHYSSPTLIIATVLYIIHRHRLSSIHSNLSIWSNPYIFSLSSDNITRQLGWSLAWHGWW